MCHEMFEGKWNVIQNPAGNMIERQIKDIIVHWMFKGKAVILVGARQVGKTTLFTEILKEQAEEPLLLNCDDQEVREMLTNANRSELALLFGSHHVVMIDEAQRVAGVGMVLKRITDNFKDVQLMVTGSSSLALQQELSEPLTGRAVEFRLFPFTTEELIRDQGIITARQQLESRLVYGSYPDIVTNQQDARTLLQNLANNYLYRDLLKMGSIRNPALLEKLLIALSLQLGSMISLNEIAQTIGTDPKTVDKYIDLLEKCYIVFRLPSFSRNLRNELKKSRKIYFWDNGIRNAVISNFSPVGLRTDMGPLWENFFISERIKSMQHQGRYVKSYFWRTDKQQEIDYVEEEDGQIRLFELKWNPKKGGARLPNAFLEAYHPAETAVVTPANFWSLFV